MDYIKKNTWYVLANDLQTRMRGRGLAGWESMDLPLPFPLEYLSDGQCVGSMFLFNVDHERTEDDLRAMIGKQVVKCSGNGKRASKPFKSGNKQNTVKDLIVSPYTNKLAFIFNEDDSCVDCDQCCLAFIEENTSNLMQIVVQPSTPKGFNKMCDIMEKDFPSEIKNIQAIRDGFNAIMEG